MKTFTPILLLLFSCVSFSQDEIVAFTAHVYNESEIPLKNVIINTYKNDSLFRTDTTKQDGAVVNIVLPIGANYRMVIGKEGYVSKTAAIDAHFKSENNLWTKNPEKFEVVLFEECDAGDFEFMKTEPLIKYRFDSTLFFNYDKAHAKMMRKKVEHAKYAKLSDEDREIFSANYFGGMEQMGLYNFDEGLDLFLKAKEIVDCPFMLDKIRECKKEQKKQIVYDRFMAEANRLYSESKMDEALVQYKKAHKIRPRNYDLSKRILEIKFDKAVTQGDSYYKIKDYDKAIDFYDQAIKLKRENGLLRKRAKCIRKAN